MSRTPTCPAAVVFDCDGLLLDTEGLWAAAERLFVEDLGGTWHSGLHRLTHGRAVPESARLLAATARAELTGCQAADELTERFTRVVARAPARELTMPGAVALLDELAAMGVPLAVASNTPPPHLSRLLERAGVLDRFAAAVGPGEGLRAKPQPDLYTEACRLLGVDPAEAHALEDSQTGIDAAHAAGLAVTGVNADPGVGLTGCRRVTTLAALTPATLGAAGPGRTSTARAFVAEKAAEEQAGAGVGDG